MTDFKNVLRLINKTGDKAIIMEENEPSFVIMALAEYEKMIDRSSLRNDRSLHTYSNTVQPNPPYKTYVETEHAMTANAKPVPQRMNQKQSGKVSEEELMKRVNQEIEAYRKEHQGTVRI